MSTPKSVLGMAEKEGAKMVDIKFVDTLGAWHHFSMPTRELSEESFSEGLGFDGSSIRGWKSIEASTLLAMPDPLTAFIDPFCVIPTLSLTCTITDTITREAYTHDPRGIAQTAEKYLIHRGFPGNVGQHPAQGTRRPATASASLRALPLTRRIMLIRLSPVECSPGNSTWRGSSLLAQSSARA